MGRLHTRYSPVRRSPPASYPAALPLDLHVLSLSLAFILSQDQTLRCCLSFYFSFSVFSALRKISTKLSGIFRSSTQQRPNLSLFTFRFTRNHDVDSVVISFPCLSLFPCLSQSFQWPLSFLSANYSKQIRDPYHHPSFFSFAVAKVLQKILSIQTFSKLFFKFFHHLSETSPLSAHYTHKKFML